MAFTLDLVRADIKRELLARLPHNRVYSGGVPTFADLKYENNVLKPYVVLVNSTLRRWPTGGSYAGARHDPFYVTVDLLSVAGAGGGNDPAQAAEAQQSKIIDEMLGYRPPHAGELNLAPGVGGTYTVMNEQMKPAAFISPVGFRVSLDVLEVP